MKKIIYTGVVEPEVEDRGMAMIANIEEAQGHDDGCFFVRLHSWDDENAYCDGSAEENAKCGHPTMNSLIGKKVRVTVEVID